MSVSLFSCTIQKRSFNSGYHIEWKTKLQNQPQKNIEKEVLLSSSKQVDNSDSSTNTSLFASDIESLNDNEVFSEKIKIQDLKENILHKENDDTVEMYTYTYKKKTIIASNEDIQKVEKKRIVKKSFLLIGFALLLISLLFTFLGLSSLESGILIIALICGILSIILLISGCLISIVLFEMIKSMILKHNTLLKQSSNESTPNSEESLEVYPTVEPNPKSKRNLRIFLVLILASIIGFIVFKNF